MTDKAPSPERLRGTLTLARHEERIGRGEENSRSWRSPAGPCGTSDATRKDSRKRLRSWRGCLAGVVGLATAGVDRAQGCCRSPGVDFLRRLDLKVNGPLTSSSKEAGNILPHCFRVSSEAQLEQRQWLVPGSNRFANPCGDTE